MSLHSNLHVLFLEHQYPQFLLSQLDNEEVKKWDYQEYTLVLVMVVDCWEHHNMDAVMGLSL